MSKIIEIVAEPLTVDGFSGYGTAILLPTNPAPKVGNNWDCWFGFGSVGGGNDTIGMVYTRPSNELIEHMEAHLHPEFLIPITGPVIQPLALPQKDGDPGDRPDTSKVKAFIIQPGQSIIIGKGVWHYAAIPLIGDVWYYFMGHSVWDGPGTDENPWIPFLADNKIKIVY